MPKYVELQELLAGLPRSGTMTTSAARSLANDILDACEAVDPTEEESEWERDVEAREQEMTDDHLRLVEQRQQNKRAAAKVDDPTWRNEVTTKMGLTINDPSPHCVQFRKAGKVFAEWWPSRGTTMHAQKRGPICRDASSVVRWLRTLTA